MTLIVHCAKRLTTCTYLVSIITQQSIIFIHFKDRYLLYWTSGIWTQICSSLKAQFFPIGHTNSLKRIPHSFQGLGLLVSSLVSQPDVDRCKQGGSHLFFFFSGTPAGWGGLGWQELRVRVCSFLTALPEASWWRGKDFPQPDIKGSGQGLPRPGWC